MLQFKLFKIQFTLILSLGFISMLSADADTMYVSTTGSTGSWILANNSCISSGGNLVSIHSVGQDAALGNYKEDNELFRPWIGGKANSYGDNFNCDTFNFSWSDGTPWDYEPSTFDCNDEGTYSGVYIHTTHHWGVHPTHQAVGICAYSSCDNISGCSEISYEEDCAAICEELYNEGYTVGLEEGILIGSQSGDANGDGTLNILVLVYFVDVILNP